MKSLHIGWLYAAAFVSGFFLPFLDMMSGPHFHGWIFHSFVGLLAVGCLEVWIMLEV